MNCSLFSPVLEVEGAQWLESAPGLRTPKPSDRNRMGKLRMQHRTSWGFSWALGTGKRNAGDVTGREASWEAYVDTAPAAV